MENEKTIKDLEKEKIELEIKNLNKNWYKKPEYLRIFVPIFLGIITLYFAFINGYFSAKSSELKTQQTLLSIKKEKVKTQIDSLDNQLINYEHKSRIIQDSLERINLRMIDSLNNLSSDYNSMILEYKNLKNEYIKSRSKEQFLNEQINVIIEQNKKINNKVSTSIENANKRELERTKNEGVIDDWLYEKTNRKSDIPLAPVTYVLYSKYKISVKRFCRINGLNFSDFTEDNPKIGSRIEQGEKILIRKSTNEIKY